MICFFCTRGHLGVVFLSEINNVITVDKSELQFQIQTESESWIFETTGANSSDIRNKMIDGLKHLIKINNAMNHSTRHTQSNDLQTLKILIQNCGNTQCNGEYFPLELLKNQSPMFQNQFNVMLSKEAAKDGSLGWVIGIANVPIYGIFGDTFYPPTEKWAAFDTNNNPPPKLSILQTTINNEEARITNVDVGFYNDEEEDGGMISV